MEPPHVPQQEQQHDQLWDPLSDSRGALAKGLPTAPHSAEFFSFFNGLAAAQPQRGGRRAR